ncbi:hypothetical protein B0T26DRAFT_705920 [Lasiosphaeria miniovina]|uniref:Uncharacterized protein n=1 Tax=Lasiosphaeria miniovina TaxID=1954250 RepID=A0AA40AWJ4_9PEZI|nr:uncharacterized protein B0T26DRAFT_705920 [Lasiosphaeria miniovina]KAK0723256.1 hypothetical protein B0T26DRAFT_705920 [Lasiosphaeria miniovina]
MWRTKPKRDEDYPALSHIYQSAIRSCQWQPSFPRFDRCVTSAGEVPKVRIPDYSRGENYFIWPDDSDGDGDKEEHGHDGGEAITPLGCSTGGASSRNTSSTAGAGASCFLGALPLEIVRLIVGFLVPTGCIVEFLKCRQWGRPWDHGIYPRSKLDWAFVPIGNLHAVVHQMAPSILAPSIDLGLAYTNRAFNSIVFEQFYGNNYFIFHLSTAEVGVEIKSDNFNAWQSCSRKFGRHPTSDPQSFVENPAFGSLGPLSSRTAKYLRSVMLVVSSPWRPVKNQGVHHLTPIVSGAVDILLGSGNISEAAQLEQLDLHFAAEPEFYYQRYYHIIEGLHVNFDQEKGKMVVEFKSEPMHRSQLDDRVPPSHTKLLAPAEQLLRLRQVGRVSVSGDIKESFTRRLQETVTRNEDGEGMETKRSLRTKRRKLNQ